MVKEIINFAGAFFSHIFRSVCKEALVDYAVELTIGKITENLEKEVKKFLIKSSIIYTIKIISFAIAIQLHTQSLFFSSSILLCLLCHTIYVAFPSCKTACKLIFYAFKTLSISKTILIYLYDKFPCEKLFVDCVRSLINSLIGEKFQNLLPGDEEYIRKVYERTSPYLIKKFLFLILAFLIYIAIMEFFAKPYMLAEYVGLSFLKIYVLPFTISIDYFGELFGMSKPLTNLVVNF